MVGLHDWCVVLVSGRSLCTRARRQPEIFQQMSLLIRGRSSLLPTDRRLWQMLEPVLPHHSRSQAAEAALLCSGRTRPASVRNPLMSWTTPHGVRVRVRPMDTTFWWASDHQHKQHIPTSSRRR